MIFFTEIYGVYNFLKYTNNREGTSVVRKSKNQNSRFGLIIFSLT